jgi:hypothetical protein
MLSCIFVRVPPLHIFSSRFSFIRSLSYQLVSAGQSIQVLRDQPPVPSK